jgi:Uma2 family endonuclease
MADIEKTGVTAAEFRALPETTQPTELIEGEIVMSPAPKHLHQRIAFRVARYIDDQAPKGETVIAPSDVYLDDVNAVQPDVFWVSADNPRCALGDDDYWYGAPDLVVEVLSPATEAKDRGAKFRLYEAHGVRELWLVQPQTPFVEVFTRQNKQFGRQGLYEPKDTFTSAVLGNKIVALKSILGE